MNGKGSVIRALAVHCTMGRGRAWAGVAAVLGPSFSVTAPDLPGHGSAGPWSGVSNYTADCLRTLDAVWTDETYLVGHSFGAVLALHMAARAPDRVAGLALIEPVLFQAARGKPGYADHAVFFDRILVSLAAGDRASAAQAFHGLWGIGTWDDMPKRAQDSMARAMHIIAAQDETLNTPEALSILTQVQAPVLLIEGVESPPVIAEISETLSAQLGARRVRISGTGHMAPTSHPIEVAEAIRHHATCLGSSSG